MATFEKTKTVVTTRCHVKAAPLRSGVVINGEIVPAGAICEVGMHEAADIVARGLAVDATPAEVASAGENIIVAASRCDKWADAA
jgi:hypothetical protein